MLSTCQRVRTIGVLCVSSEGGRLVGEAVDLPRAVGSHVGTVGVVDVELERTFYGDTTTISHSSDSHYRTY